MLNCRPGDLAVIIDSDPIWNPDTGGVLCDVIDHPPASYFNLPDGTPADSSGDPSNRWVIRLHRPVMVRWTRGEIRTAVYAVCPDNKLRPIRPQADDAQDEMLKPLPQEITA